MKLRNPSIQVGAVNIADDYEMANALDAMLAAGKPKYYVSYYRPGEFGNDALWGVTVKYADGREGACAFYKTLEAALEAYPEAVRI